TNPDAPLVVVSEHQRRRVVSWRDSTDYVKVNFAVRAVGDLGTAAHAHAFTLNLNPNLELRARSNPDWLSRRLVRYLRRATGHLVPLIMVLGAANGRLHVTGAFVAEIPEERARIEEALKAAAGPWASRRGQGHQLDVRRLGVARPAAHWGTYLHDKNLIQ